MPTPKSADASGIGYKRKNRTKRILRTEKEKPFGPFGFESHQAIRIRVLFTQQASEACFFIAHVLVSRR
jgi:hypothetical protein